LQKIKVIFLAIFFIFVVSSGAIAAPDIAGEAFILIDAQSGQILDGKNYDVQLHPASTTKILTTILALEKGKLTDKVTVSKNAPAVEGTKVYLREGETVTLEQLLNAVMVHSANDAAVAIAEHIGGSVEAFVELMNEKAKEIGAKNTKFVNTHGLTNEEHLTTAYDLAMISRYAMQNPQFRELAAKKVYDWEGLEWQTRLINKNKFLWRMQEATGIKPGYTSQAKYTLAASAEKNGQELICVILGSSENRIWDDAKALLEYGFTDFRNINITENNNIVATLQIDEEKEVNLATTRAANFVVANNEQIKLETKVVLKDFSFPIHKGDILGELKVMINGEEAESIPLQSLEEIKKPIVWHRIVINLLAATFLLQIAVRLYRRWRKRRRKYLYRSTGRRINTYRF